MAELTRKAFLLPPPPLQYRVCPNPVQNRVNKNNKICGPGGTSNKKWQGVRMLRKVQIFFKNYTLGCANSQKYNIAGCTKGLVIINARDWGGRDLNGA